ncbi:MAG: hypothetical protein NT004_15840 [Bacteroidetes bacterium]|nr:hypothetical protein [Bacteroidota bacterium]
MNNLKITGLVMVILLAMLSISCSNDKSTGESYKTNPELLKILKESDWASYQQGVGYEMKFIGEDKVVIFQLSQDPTTGVWSRKGSDVATVEFVDDNWFLLRFKNSSVACLFSKDDYTIEDSNGAIFKKSQIGAFKRK